MRAAIDDVVELKRLIEEQGLQQWRVAEILGVSVSCVERTCKRLGLKTQRTGPRSGPGHTGWKGGRYLVGGYWQVWAPEHPNATKAGYVAEHRLVMEQKLGRLLERTEVVHHIDKDRQNNAPGNLALFANNAEHLRHELAGRCPNWSQAGKARIVEAVRQTANRRRGLKRDDYRRLQTNPRFQDKS
jgi:hypothetical protein